MVERKARISIGFLWLAAVGVVALVAERSIFSAPDRKGDDAGSGLIAEVTQLKKQVALLSTANEQIQANQLRVAAWSETWNLNTNLATGGFMRARWEYNAELTTGVNRSATNSPPNLNFLKNKTIVAKFWTLDSDVYRVEFVGNAQWHPDKEFELSVTGGRDRGADNGGQPLRFNIFVIYR